jgi:hypothetical protein
MGCLVLLAWNIAESGACKAALGGAQLRIRLRVAAEAKSDKSRLNLLAPFLNKVGNYYGINVNSNRQMDDARCTTATLNKVASLPRCD